VFLRKNYLPLQPKNSRRIIMAKVNDGKGTNTTVTPEAQVGGGLENESVFESAEALQDNLVHTLDKAKGNSPFVLGGLGLIVVIIGGFLFYKWNNQRQNEAAQKELFPAQFYLEKDSLNKAFKGDNNNSTSGIEAVANDYSGTAGGDLASFYVGIARLKEGKYDEAIAALEKFNPNDYILQARAFSLIGDAYSEKKDWASATKYYQKAADFYPNEEYTPTYLVKLAQVQEANGDLEGAKKSYQTIVDKFEKSTERTTAEKNIARLEAKATVTPAK
jgi:TolA-binding protein